MIKDRYQRVSELFQQAVQCDDEERAAFLDQACDGDPELRSEVESLLACDSPEPEQAPNPNPGGAFEAMREAIAGETVDPDDHAVPSRIGRYRPIRVIGQGGMGIVYEAQQDQPQRHVALKVLARHAVSAQMLRRFRQEAEILGRLKHPGIAQIFDAGRLDRTDGGHAFLAMELVDGRPLTEHANAADLNTRQRLTLFALICDAVHHAHQKGIIHRDLKPDNILIMPEGNPKILDFGIARVTDADLQVTTIQTHAGQLVGTITYMSPEQVSCDRKELDLRSDIYALGVILFELLAGVLPHDLVGRSIPEAVRLIQEVDPLRLGSVNTMYRGDLDVIVAKALEKDASRRYLSASEMAADIRRHLNDEPISARPASTFYQLRKFARRHKPIVGGALATLIALVVGLIFSINFAMRESDQRMLADQASSAAAASEFQSRRTAYRANLSAALASIRSNDPTRARIYLDDTDISYRGWEWEHLNTRLDTQLASYPSEAEADVVRRPDGTLVGLLVRDGQPVVIDIETGEAIGSVRYTLPLEQCKLSGNGRRIGAVSPNEDALLIFDADAGDLLSRCLLENYKNTEWDLNWDGSLAATWQERVRLKIIDTGTGNVRYEAGRRFTTDVCFDQNGSTALHSIWRRVQLVQRQGDAGDFVMQRETRVEDAQSMRFDSEGSRVAIGLQFGLVRLLDIPTLDHGHTLSGINGMVLDVGFSGNGRIVGASGADSTLQLWDSASGERRSAILAPTSTSIALDHDGTSIASGNGQEIALWASSSPAAGVLRGHNSYIYFVTFSPDGTMLASAAWDNTVRIWDMRTWEQLASMPFPFPKPWGLSFSADGSTLVSGYFVWNASTGERIEWLTQSQHEAQFRLKHIDPPSLPWPDKVPTVDRSELFKWPENPNAPDDWKTGLDFWHLARGGAKFLSGLGGQTRAMSHDGSLIAIETDEWKTSLLVLDRITGREMRRFGPFDKGVSATAFSDDGSLLALGDEGGTIHIQNLDSATEVATLRGHKNEVFSVSFSPDGTRLVSGGRDGVVRLWDTKRWDLVLELVGHTGYVHSVAFSPDGSQIASGSGDNTIRIWDTVAPSLRRKQAQAATKLRDEMTPVVDRLLEEHSQPSVVAEHLRNDPSIGATQRKAAARVLLMRSQSDRRVDQ